MRTRRTPVLVGALAVLVTLAGCGSQTAPTATTTPGTSPLQQNGTSPSPPSPSPLPSMSAPSVGDDHHGDGIVSESKDPRAFAISDSDTGDFVAGLGNGDVVIGEVGIHGIGAAWGTRRVTVRRTAAGVDAHYDGPGRLERHAPLDLGFAALSLSGMSGDPQPIRLRFEVHLDADGLGHADVWIDERHVRLVAAEPP